MVTTNTTPTVNPAPPTPRPKVTPSPRKEEENEMNDTLGSYCSMQSLMDNDEEVEDEAEEINEAVDENEPEVENKVVEAQETVTKSGKVSKAPGWLDNYAVLALTEAERNYQAQLKEYAKMEFAEADYRIDHELAGMGSGIGGGFNNTSELRAMKYDEAMATDGKGWRKAVEDEHN